MPPNDRVRYPLFGLRAVPAPLAVVILANVVFGTGLFFHAFLYNFYLEALGHAEATMGHAAAALTFGGLVALLPAGSVTDRLGVRTALVTAAVVVTAGLTAGALVEHPGAIYLAAAVAGAGGGIWRVASPPTLMRLAPGELRPRAFAWNVGLLIASGGLGMAVAGSVPTWLEHALGLDHLAAIRAALLLGAAGGALSVPLFAALPRQAATPSPHPLVDPGPAGPAQEIPSYLTGARIALAVFFVGLWMLGPALAAPFLNIFFARRFTLTLPQVGGIFALAHLLWGGAVFVSGSLAGRVGVLRFLALALALFAPAMLGLSWAASLPLAVALFLVQGLISPLANPLIDQLLLGGVSPRRYGLVSSWRNAAADLSALAGASAGGVLLRATSFGVLLAAAGAVGCCGAVGLVTALRRVAPATVTATRGGRSPAAGADAL